jgi:Zn-finger nucleic acid-binding protein
MVVLEVERIEIDHCVACHGVWLDGGELELLLETAANRDELMATLADAVEGKERKVRCPICNKRMDKTSFGAEEKIILDKCPKNDGIWFDSGELCRALRMAEFEGRPIYEILNEIFGDKCRNDPD